MASEDVFVAIVVWCIWFGVWGAVTASYCEQSTNCGVLHGILLGPAGLLLVSLYPRYTPDESQKHSAATNELLTEEKEMHRAKAAQASKQ